MTGVAASILIAAATAGSAVTYLIVPLVNRGLAARARDTLDVAPLNLAGTLDLSFLALQLAVFIPAVVLVIVWMWRARKNLEAFPGIKPGMGAGWAIGGWFIPFASLVIPFRVMNSIAVGSLWRTGTHPLVGFWWAAYLISGCASGVEGQFDLQAAERLPQVLAGRGDLQLYVDYYQGSVARGVVSTGLLAIAGILLIILIRRISQAQTTRIARAYQLAAPPPTPATGFGTPA